MKLLHVSDDPLVLRVLYELLAERPPEATVTHQVMPSPEEHAAFVRTHPFRFWYVLDVGGDYVGALEATDRNELGVSVLIRHQRKGYGRLALELFLKTHWPLPAIKAYRNGAWLANIAAYNHHSKFFFKKIGFRLIQETYAYD